MITIDTDAGLTAGVARSGTAPERGGTERAAAGGTERATAEDGGRKPEPSAAPAEARRPITLPEFRNIELSFRIEEGGRVVVQVIDAKTKTVLRSIPPEELVRLARERRGLLVDRES